MKEISSWRESAHLGPNETSVDSSLEFLEAKDIVRRIWAHDHTVWRPDPSEISNRLDWLHSPRMMMEKLPRLDERVQEVREGGFSRVLLLGMGGSSLASAVFAKVFGGIDGYAKLTVLDSTDPDTVLAASKGLDLEQTLFIVSSKSGGTVETLSLMKYFYARVTQTLSREKAGRHFIAITDPGSDLSLIAERNGFREEILNDPNIGGRYSVLSYDGLVPAALMGVDLPRLLEAALSAASACGPGLDTKSNSGARLGAILGGLAKNGRDKVTFAISPRIGAFGDWLEQLIAESTGKEGKGILPVVGAELGSPAVYGSDCLFISLRLDGDTDRLRETALSELEAAGHPVVRIRLRDSYDLGGQFFLWEMATAVAGSIIGVNPFDQPNVESTKVLARMMIADYMSKGRLPRPTATLTMNDVTVFGDVVGSSPHEMITNFLASAKPGAYIAIQAYVQQTDSMDKSLGNLRKLLMNRYRLATTIGYGPRFLHSTGQLHKGDSGRGYFLQISSDGKEDLPIPDTLGSAKSSVSLGVLTMAEAFGDRQALLGAGRNVISLHVRRNVEEVLDSITRALKGVGTVAG